MRLTLTVLGEAISIEMDGDQSQPIQNVQEIQNIHENVCSALSVCSICGQSAMPATQGRYSQVIYQGIVIDFACHRLNTVQDRGLCRRCLRDAFAASAIAHDAMMETIHK